MSLWEDYAIEDRIRDLLALPEFQLKEKHEFLNLSGCPFVTTYQLAAAFAIKHPGIFSELGMRVGGLPSDDGDSLARYFAGELTRRIIEGQITDIEGAWLSSSGLDGLHFKYEGEVKAGHPNSKYNAFTMFRLVK